MPSLRTILSLTPLLTLASAVGSCPKQREQTFTITNFSWIRNNWSGGAPGNVHRLVLNYFVETEFNENTVMQWVYSHIPAEETTPLRYVTVDKVGVWKGMSLGEYDIFPYTRQHAETSVGFDFKQTWNCTETEGGPSRAVEAQFTVSSEDIDSLVRCVDNPKTGVVKECRLTEDSLAVTGFAEYV